MPAPADVPSNELEKQEETEREPKKNTVANARRRVELALRGLTADQKRRVLQSHLLVVDDEGER